MKYLLYHENNIIHPELPQEDYFVNNDEIFIVNDGITHDLDENGNYPKPSDAYLVAKITGDTILGYLKVHGKSLKMIKSAYKTASKEVQKFQKGRKLYKDRETNGYSIGACVSATGVFIKNKFLYGVIDDCYVSVFNDDIVDHPMLKWYIGDTNRYYNQKIHGKPLYDWQKAEDKKVFRKDMRNNVFIVDRKEYGYGAIDGREGYEKYMQLGEVELKENDLICVYSDGFIKSLADKEFVKSIYCSDLSEDTEKYIKGYLRANKFDKEKTCYFIRYTNIN
jgi:hypothetical protein